MKLNGYIGTIREANGYLYRNCTTKYKILIPADSTESEQFAASELTDIFAKAGVAIETVTDLCVCPSEEARFISLGNTSYFRYLGIELLPQEFKFYGFIIESVGNSYVIKGVGDTGTCFGVYGFAEYVMGYVYYAEDEYKIAYEARNKELHIKDIPTFFGRNAFSHDSAYIHDHGFRLRINGFTCHREKKYGEDSPWASLNDQSLAMQILDYRKYRDEHPDWYYLDPKNYDAKPPRCYPQICFSKGLYDKEFFDLFMHNLLNDYIIPEKDKVFFMLGMSDNTDFCNCKTCMEEVKKYTRSGLSMRFVNKVADAVEKWRLKNAPERVIFLISFAYLTTFDSPVVKKQGKLVPVDESVVGRDNVIIRYAPFKANYLYSLMDEKHNAQSRDSILGWSTVAKHMCVWDYRQDFHDVVFPFPTTLTAQANIDTYTKFGVVDIFNQAQRFCPGSPFIDMDNFARARLHWNAKENYKMLCDEFRIAYYKDAEPYVTEYLRAIESFYPVLEKRGYDGYCHNGATHRPDFYTKEDLEHFKEILDKALDAAKGISDREQSEKVYNRVEVLTLYYKCVLLMCFSQTISKKEALSLLSEVRQLTEKYGVRYYCKWNETKDYLDDIENVIKGKISSDERRFPLRYKE